MSKHWLGVQELDILRVARGDAAPASGDSTHTRWVQIPTIVGYPSDWPPQFRYDRAHWISPTWWQRLVPAGVDVEGLRAWLSDHLHTLVARHLSHHVAHVRRARNPYVSALPVADAQSIRELAWEVWADHLDARIAAVSFDGRTDPLAQLMPYDVYASPIGQIDGLAYGSTAGLNTTLLQTLAPAADGHGRIASPAPGARTVTVPAGQRGALVVLGGGRLWAYSTAGASSAITEYEPGEALHVVGGTGPGSYGVEWRRASIETGDVLTIRAAETLYLDGLHQARPPGRARPVILPAGSAREVSRGELGARELTVRLGTPDPAARGPAAAFTADGAAEVQPHGATSWTAVSHATTWPTPPALQRGGWRLRLTPVAEDGE